MAEGDDFGVAEEGDNNYEDARDDRGYGVRGWGGHAGAIVVERMDKYHGNDDRDHGGDNNDDNEGDTEFE